MWIDKFVRSKLWRTACGQTDGQTDVRRTDKSLKTEGPMILSIDIFYFKTVIIGGPMIAHIAKTDRRADGQSNRHTAI